MKPSNTLIALNFLFGLLPFGLCSVGHAQPHDVSQADVDMHKKRINDKRLVITTPIIYQVFKQKRPSRPPKNPDHNTGHETINKTKNNSKKDLYIRIANIGYFVKFCSSQVTRAEIEAELTQSMLAKKKQRKTNPALVTLDVTITEGNWDICEHDATIIQSRIGEYAIVHHIIHRTP